MKWTPGRAFSEACVVVLDVTHKPVIGSGWEAFAALFMSRLATTFNITRQEWSAPNDPIALVRMGTNGTSNSLHAMFKDEDGPGQYLHLTEDLPLDVHDERTLDLSQPPPVAEERGTADILDALALACHILGAKKEMQGNIGRRIVLISPLLGNFAEDEDNEATKAIQTVMAEMGARLDVIHLATDGHDSNVAVQRNREKLQEIFAGHGRGAPPVHGRIRVCRDPPSTVAAALPEIVKPPAGQKNGVLWVGRSASVEVQIWKAHATPNMLSPKMEAVGAAGPSGAGSADRLVDRQTIYVVESAEGEAPQEVMPEDRRKSYRFGGDLVPLSSAVERMLKFDPQDAPGDSGTQSLQLLGFVPSRCVAPWTTRAPPSVVAPRKHGAAACTALSALSRAMRARDQVAIVRHLNRTTHSLAVCALVPHPERDHFLVLKPQLFAEDHRGYLFPSFASLPEVHKPTKSDLETADALIGDMTWPRGQTLSSRFPNPARHRELKLAHRASLGQGPPAWEEEALTRAIREMGGDAQSAGARQAWRELFA